MHLGGQPWLRRGALQTRSDLEDELPQREGAHTSSDPLHLGSGSE